MITDHCAESCKSNMSDSLPRKLWIQQPAPIHISFIVPHPGQQRGFRRVGVCFSTVIKVDSLLAFKVNWQTDNFWGLMMHWSFTNVPGCLTGREVFGIQKHFYLINWCCSLLTPSCRPPKSHSHICSIRTLEDIFVEIFDDFDPHSQFHIDVTIVLGRQPRIVRHYPLIPIGPTAFGRCSQISILRAVRYISATVLWVAIFYNFRFWFKWLREVLTTLVTFCLLASVDFALVDIELGNGLVELRMGVPAAQAVVKFCLLIS